MDIRPGIDSDTNGTDGAVDQIRVCHERSLSWVGVSEVQYGAERERPIALPLRYARHSNDE
jgi:hypothetical protein